MELKKDRGIITIKCKIYSKDQSKDCWIKEKREQQQDKVD